MSSISSQIDTTQHAASTYDLELRGSLGDQQLDTSVDFTDDAFDEAFCGRIWRLATRGECFRRVLSAGFAVVECGMWLPVAPNKKLSTLRSSMRRLCTHCGNEL